MLGRSPKNPTWTLKNPPFRVPCYDYDLQVEIREKGGFLVLR